ncbi:trypsin-like serine peptidase [Streptomyces qinglanensis]|uniref:Trypsin-like peptidase domain-containing protein n=1 Tax=Streptomyces qinglanensis TaxID=943816 RepID=A0A1H9WQ23_9ACTN|nr:trypsin-like peptidase domain-containing protein [Streptomyces qinglanensis]SES35911.1 Trypsin-like peptidase domain-containing protein [Streptomyces qinglanensis]
MPSIARSARRRPALAAAAVAAVLAVTATACGPEDDNADAKADSAASQEASRDAKKDLGLPDDLPKDLPTSLDDLDAWKNGAWKNWDRDKWLKEAKEFFNPIIDDLWDPDRMKDADGNDREVDDSDIDDGPSGGSDGTGEDEGVTDPKPEAVEAAAVKTPYTKDDLPVGKVFMDTPKGAMVCSGSVLKDPRHPGKSNLVATAGHCVHGGAGKGWYRNVIFVPDYNPTGLSNKQLATASQSQVAPDGIWWAKRARTTKHWIQNGAERGGKGAQQDFAVLQVQPEDKSSASLEEKAGGALQATFTTPQVKSIKSLGAVGYPAAPPFDGSRMYRCDDKPGRLTIDPQQPSMYRIGCTMTAGSSGGPWLDSSGTRLLSVTSIGPITADWLAGARLGKEAKAVFDTVSKEG